ncbi:unnamed protein product, partial [Protopolystoma xenopodis]
PEGHQPEFTKKPPAVINLKAGQTFAVEAEVNGQPEPNVSWYKSGLEIVPDHRHRFERGPEVGQVRLVLCPCDLEDEGDYQVVATNTFGIAKVYIRITVSSPQRSPSPLAPTHLVPVFHPPAQEVPAQPAFQAM